MTSGSGINEVSVHSGISRVLAKALIESGCAEPFLQIPGFNDAKLVSTKTAKFIIKFFANHPDYCNEKAIQTMDQIEQTGLDTWVDRAAGVEKEDPNGLSIQETLGLLLGKVTDMDRRLEKFEGYQIASIQYTGLTRFLDELTEETTTKLLEPTKELFTMREALEKIYPGMVFTQKQYRQITLKVSQTLESLTDKPTPVIVDMKNYRRVKGYSPQQFCLIKTVIPQIINH
jgi:hypothetical protein